MSKDELARESELRLLALTSANAENARLHHAITEANEFARQQYTRADDLARQLAYSRAQVVELNKLLVAASMTPIRFAARTLWVRWFGTRLDKGE